MRKILMVFFMFILINLIFINGCESAPTGRVIQESIDEDKIIKEEIQISPQKEVQPKIELRCPASCDDYDSCTKDYCNSLTNYKCIHEKIFPCCGNDICESKESHSSCPSDCPKPTCTTGYLDETRCSGNKVEMKYQYSNCDTKWIYWFTCDGECSDGKCIQTITVPLTPIEDETEMEEKKCKWGYSDEYKCDGKVIQRKWVNSNCSFEWFYYLTCFYGCENGECIDKPQKEQEIPNCSVGYLEEYRCDGANIEKKYQHSDCSFTWFYYKHCDYGCYNGKCNLEPEKIIVSYVLDGDTIQLSTGEKVRLIGINAPEQGQACSSEATSKLRQFVLGKEITLEQDIDNKDQYRRLLRYIYFGDTFVNVEMVRLGLAHKYEYGSNTKYSSQFEQAEDEAKQNEGCLWKTSPEEQCIYIINFHFNAAGDDNYNLNDEYVIFGNKCSHSIDMAGWTIKDETASHIYAIPSFTFQSGTTFTLYTGTGTNTNSALYWGRTPGNYAAIWNNGGDTLYLRDRDGNLVLSYSY